MKRNSLFSLSAAAALGLVGVVLAIQPASSAALQDADSQTIREVARGGYLVKIMGCNDCHTPWKVSPDGHAEPDMTRMLSGHPQDLVMPPLKPAEAPWAWTGAGTNTAFSGPWGVSFTANLTPDIETGLGKWNADTFVRALRTGRHEGQGRPILPPMPYPMYRNATDEDLHAIFTFLQSIPPIRNRVPQPIDPPESE
ncbi:MAG TPA: diheme cytochrome c-553 [Terriglobia bacterium]|nr:diheme cytochrome c-553 [Terriglobia bacterium]